MNSLGLNGMSIVALVVALVAMLIALWRARRQPELLLNREQALERRVAELEATVATLQRLLLEKERQNGSLQEQVTALTAKVRDLERTTATPQPAPVQADRPVLLVVTGLDPALSVDLAMLRSREIADRLRLVRLRNGSKAAVADTLRRYRSRGTPVPYVHFAVHAGPQGLELAGELADGVWLSETLADAEVVLLAGCQTAAVAELLGVARCVVSLTDEVSHQDAATFSLAFWSQVAAGAGPEAAFYEAVRRSPAGVGECAELAM